MKYWLLVFLFVFFISATSAIEDDEIYPYGKNANITQPCYLANATGSTNLCSASAVCNITVKNNLHSIVVNAQPMTNSNGQFNYTIPGSLTNFVGQGDYQIYCCDGGFCGTRNFPFFVSKTGFFPSGSQISSNIFTILILLTGSVFCFVKSFSMHGSNHRDESGNIMGINKKKYGKAILFFFGFWFLVFFLNAMWQFTEAVILVDLTAKVFYILYIITLWTGIIMIPVGIFMFWMWWIKDNRIFNMIQRGFTGIQ